MNSWNKLNLKKEKLNQFIGEDEDKAKEAFQILKGSFALSQTENALNNVSKLKYLTLILKEKQVEWIGSIVSQKSELLPIRGEVFEMQSIQTEVGDFHRINKETISFFPKKPFSNLEIYKESQRILKINEPREISLKEGEYELFLDKDSFFISIFHE